MKKTIKIVTALSFVVATSSSIIACSNPFVDAHVLRITIVTDGHTITDHSFNESSYNAALQFKSEFEQWVSDPNSDAPADLRQKKVVVTPIQPPTTDLTTLISSYGQSVVMNSVATVASGFIQSDALIAAQNKFLKHKMRYIYVDGDTPNNVVPQANKNLAGLLYKAEESGLLAALAAGSWLMAHRDEYGSDLKMSTYGGLNISAVSNYMYGFYWGIELINNSQKYSPDLHQAILQWVKKLNPQFAGSQLPHLNFVNLPNQFTGSFDQASASSIALNDALVAKGTNVIFPVAGPQTADTLAALKATNGKVIGVDTDQQKQYSASADYFLTSALKNIVGSVNYMLWRAIGYDETSEHNPLTPKEEKEIFQENAPYRGGKNFVGIADNAAINPVYNDIINNKELNKPGGFLEQVSQGWQKVLAAGSNDLWTTGKDINPFK